MVINNNKNPFRSYPLIILRGMTDSILQKSSPYLYYIGMFKVFAMTAQLLHIRLLQVLEFLIWL